ncbi:SpoIIE family protein phosphatase [Sulfitobacter sp. D35]|uniref:PP2C family protein-serine/threonine phosphatase n=1 Tax=Sulfitobacter sp. D35 TaxID=3083252 RepID=UPI00296F683F|nr:SpoIIE family protein phosphatase [Sulfitobacter sp. D35]MDW4498051.1 SpoIIE family protein phosphatase [Sulfitobacter sp. D35]
MLLETDPTGLTGQRARARAALSVLVVDDSPMQRRVLSGLLGQAGHAVTEAGSGEEALARSAEHPPDLVLSDWVMPGMSGIEFCQRFREQSVDQFAYFILLTSKSDKQDVAQGLDAGADDFLTKPVHGHELRARVDAGRRILRMQRELTEKNRLISETLDEMQRLYSALDSDLAEARKLQQSLVRETHRRFDGGSVSLMLRPSGHVGGDLVGFFPGGQDRVGLFAIDVSGHGVSSALMTARLAGYLSDGTPEQNIALARSDDGGHAPRPPAEAIGTLNDLILNDMSTEHYFTMLLADVDLGTGRIAIGQAGHPHPIVQRADGRIEQDAPGGFPVGLMPGASFTQYELTLDPGDRLLILSDGVAECPSKSGTFLGDDGVEGFARDLAHVRGPEFFEALIERLSRFRGGTKFPDDISGILLEFDGPS